MLVFNFYCASHTDIYILGLSGPGIKPLSYPRHADHVQSRTECPLRQIPTTCGWGKSLHIVVSSIFLCATSI